MLVTLHTYSRHLSVFSCMIVNRLSNNTRSSILCRAPFNRLSRLDEQYCSCLGILLSTLVRIIKQQLDIFRDWYRRKPLDITTRSIKSLNLSRISRYRFGSTRNSAKYPVYAWPVCFDRNSKQRFIYTTLSQVLSRRPLRSRGGGEAIHVATKQTRRIINSLF